MKIGIVTFHRAINFGGVLQAFALQNILKIKGYDCEIIDYYCPFIEAHYRTKNYFTILQLKRFFYTLLYNGELKRNIKGFEKFLANYLKISKNKYYPINLVEINEYYDKFITGSDQVWSPTCAGFDSGYFLSFVTDNSKKISYAASFGTKELPFSKTEEYINRLKQFWAISVRETSGSKIVYDLIGKKVKVVLDPTLLLKKQQWEELFDDKKYHKEKYILVYMISEDKRILELAKKMSRKTGKKVFYINDRIYKTKGVENLRKVTPDEWVRLFLNADMVFTNSFHGIAFSINFNKEFYAYYLQGNLSANERIINILSIFCLENRLEKKEICCLESIDYEKINKKLEVLRNESITFLSNSLV